MSEQQNIGLVLSGGGVRAMVFHCGVLRWLAENGKLENISHISSVSGGSLFMGLLLTKNDLKWPTSEEYIESVSPSIRGTLLSTCLQSSALLRLLFPYNWKYCLSRANILSQTISKTWKVRANISDLPAYPEWSVNGTTSETGKRFRFKHKQCGDYEVGYADSSAFSLADIMAVSAAFPVGIGPFVVNTSEMVWKKRKSWGDEEEHAEQVRPQFDKLHIYDGGVYDNLGQEPLFDIGESCFKKDIDTLLISDAGAPLAFIKPKWVLNPFRAKRIADIALDQIRALRVRSFVNFIKQNPGAGFYFQIGADAKSKITKYREHDDEIASQLLSGEWQESESVRVAAGYPTNLEIISDVNYQLLEQHGYEAAKWNMTLFS